jgi:hypothetical protein
VGRHNPDLWTRADHLYLRYHSSEEGEPNDSRHRSLTKREEIAEGPGSASSHDQEIGGTAENSGMSPSSMVGWVKMASRNTV